MTLSLPLVSGLKHSTAEQSFLCVSDTEHGTACPFEATLLELVTPEGEPEPPSEREQPQTLTIEASFPAAPFALGVPMQPLWMETGLTAHATPTVLPVSTPQTTPEAWFHPQEASALHLVLGDEGVDIAFGTTQLVPPGVGVDDLVPRQAPTSLEDVSLPPLPPTWSAPEPVEPARIELAARASELSPLRFRAAEGWYDFSATTSPTLAASAEMPYAIERAAEVTTTPSLPEPLLRAETEPPAPERELLIAHPAPALTERFAAASASTSGRPVAEGSADPSLRWHVAEQLRHYVERVVFAREPESLTLRLDPPELGVIELRVRALGTEVQAWISVEQEHTRQLLQQAYGHLREQLESRGLQLTHFDVGGQRHPQSQHPYRPPHTNAMATIQPIPAAMESLPYDGRWSVWA